MTRKKSHGSLRDALVTKLVDIIGSPDADDFLSNLRIADALGIEPPSEQTSRAHAHLWYGVIDKVRRAYKPRGVTIQAHRGLGLVIMVGDRSFSARAQHLLRHIRSVAKESKELEQFPENVLGEDSLEKKRKLGLVFHYLAAWEAATASQKPALPGETS